MLPTMHRGSGTGAQRSRHQRRFCAWQHGAALRRAAVHCRSAETGPQTETGASSADASTSASSAAGPWHVGVQTNERLLQWSDEAQRQLIKLYVGEKLKLTADQLDERLLSLATLVPDLVGKLERTKADILLALVSDLPGLAAKLLALRQLLPGVNVSALVSRHPALVMEWAPGDVAARLAELRSQLPGVKVELLVEAEPMVLGADIPAVLANITRLMGAGTDPVAVLVSDPSSVLDMQQLGLPSAIDIGDGNIVQ